MDLLIFGGDIKTDSRGLPIRIDGKDELIQRAMIRLAVRKGSFLANKQLGSDLHRLKSESSSAMAQAAGGIVQEALYGLDGVSVRSTEGRYERENDRFILSVRLIVAESETVLNLEV